MKRTTQNENLISFAVKREPARETPPSKPRRETPPSKPHRESPPPQRRDSPSRPHRIKEPNPTKPAEGDPVGL